MDLFNFRVSSGRSVGRSKHVSVSQWIVVAAAAAAAALSVHNETDKTELSINKSTLQTCEKKGYV
ncbi:hypothetical protein DERF_012533 [Dermatophagoides farinae]|uniref:Uncharacterized protein n=1 Tax=Dermatophagoides farinae TaxID=6954 RepID=A0A922L3J1_DERFA|nr:hypothetical protein DERF_012533 [Dermatophagoides farinae]